ADGITPRQPRQFHQRRTMGPPRRCSLGHGVPARRTYSAPPKPALRGGARGGRAVHRRRLAGSLRRTETARYCHRRVRDRLLPRAEHLRVVSRAGRAARLFMGRPDDGNAVVHSIDTWRHSHSRRYLPAPAKAKKWLTRAPPCSMKSDGGSGSADQCRSPITCGCASLIRSTATTSTPIPSVPPPTSSP